MNRDLSLILSIVALCVACVVGSVLYKHTTDLQLHQPCVCPDGCRDGNCEPKKPAPFKPRRPGGSTGEVGKIDGVMMRDM
jgi:hypothetical protein